MTPYHRISVAFAWVVGIMLTFAGCDINSSVTEKQQQEADSLINVAYRANDYNRLEILADSLRNAGLISDMKSSPSKRSMLRRTCHRVRFVYCRVEH